MVVDPDFPDHWKTRMLVDLLGDEAAPMFVIRIWAHCQMRRQWVFDNLPPSALKALCRFNGHANQLESALTTSGFLRRDGAGVVTVNDWETYNASLVANWSNGKKGGRPQKSLEEKPMGIPWVTHGQPMANPRHLISSSPSSLSSESKAVVCEPKPPPAFQREPFDLVFDEYPPDKRTSATFARRFWVRENLDQHAEAILTALRAAKKKPDWVTKYAPRIDNWLESKPWQGVKDNKRTLTAEATDAQAWIAKQDHPTRERIVQQYRTTSGGSTASTEDIVKLMPPKLVAIVNEYRQRGAA